MRWTPRLRMVLARRPWIHWLMVGLLAIAVAAAVAVSQAGVKRERDSWGRTKRVLVATRDVLPGQALSGATEQHDVPIAVAPTSALTPSVARRGGDMTAVQQIAIGEIIVTADVTEAAGPAALLPPGWLAVDITDVADPGLFTLGDAAAVLADGRTVAADAIVIALTTTDVVVGVSAADAAAVADAANRRAAVVALRAAATGPG